MKKILIGAIITVVSFVAGMTALYLAMPKVAPDLVTRTRIQLDSLGLIDFDPSDSIHQADLPTDTVAASQDSSVDEDCIAAIEEKRDTISILTDSLQTVLRSLGDHVRDHEVLLAQVDLLQQQVLSLESKHIQARDISDTLSKLEERQLRAILEDLDPDILELIYTQSSTRNQTKILQVMPAEKAASFIRSLVRAE